MKQTNNAIKFLMAQYRAIFKSAYVKGLATAVVLTSALAAGQAQATYSATYVNVAAVNNSQDKTIEVKDGTYFVIKSAGTGFGNGDKTDPTYFTKDIVIKANNTTGSDTADHIIQGSGSELYVYSDTGLTVKNGATLHYGGSDKATDVRFAEQTFEKGSNVYIKAGTTSGAFTRVDAKQLTIAGAVDVKNVSGINVFLTGDKIDISGKDAAITLGDADVTSSKSRAVLGWRTEKTEQGDVLYQGSDITLTKGATLNLNAKNNLGSPVDNSASVLYGSQIWGNSFTADSSFINVGADNNSSGAYAGLTVKNSTIKNSVVKVNSGATLAVLPLDYALMTIKNGKTDYDYSQQDAYMNFNGTSKVEGGTLIIEGTTSLSRGGTLEISDSTVLTAGTAQAGYDSSNTVISQNGVLAIGFNNNDLTDLKTNTRYLDGSTNPTLKISSKNLDSFLTAGTENIAYTDAAGSRLSVKDGAGRLDLTNGARLQFSDTDTVEISQFKFSDISKTNANVKAGEILVRSDNTNVQNGVIGSSGTGHEQLAGDIVIGADKMSIGKTLLNDISSSNAADLDINSSLNAKFQANVLTLGSEKGTLLENNKWTGFNSKLSALGVGEAVAFDEIHFVDGIGDIFHLKDNVTLKRDFYTKDADGNYTTTANKGGTIHGDNISIEGGKILTVSGGAWENVNNQSLTLTSGSLAISSVAGTEKQDGLDGSSNNRHYWSNGNPSSLTWNGAFVFSGAQSNQANVTVTGKKGANATLDLTNASITWGTGSLTVSGDAVDIDKEDGALEAGLGIVKITGDQFKDYINGNKAYIALQNSGVLFVDGAISGDIDMGKFTSGTTTTGVINFDTAQSGKFITTGQLSLVTGKVDGDNVTQGTPMDIGSGSIYAQAIAINNKGVAADDKNDPDTDIVTVAAGTLGVSQALTSSNHTVVFGDGPSKEGKLLLDTDLLDNANTTATGSVNTNLSFKNGSELGVEGGTWNMAEGKDITLDQASITVGDSDSAYASALTTDNIEVTAANSLNDIYVADTGALTVNTIQTAGAGKLYVEGVMTINGRADINTAADTTELASVVDAAETAGIDLTDTSITVDGSDAKLEFGTVATDKLVKVSATKDDTDGYITVNEAIGNITLANNAQLKLNMADTIKLTAEQAKELKAEAVKDMGTGFINVGKAQLDIVWDDKANLITSWDNVKDFVQVESDVANEDLLKTLVNGVSSSDMVAGRYGAIQTDFDNNTKLQVSGNLGLYNARDGYFVFNEKSGAKQAVGVALNNGSNLILEGAGKIGGISANGTDTAVYFNGKEGQTGAIEVLGDITNVSDATFNTETLVSGNVSITEGFVNANASLTAKSLNLQTRGHTDVMGQVKLSDTLSLAKDQDLTVWGGAVSTKDLTLSQNSSVTVGYEPGSNAVDDPDSPDIDESKSYTGTFEATGTTTLNGGALVVDPDYGMPTALASLNHLSTGANDKTLTAGLLDGGLYVGKNAALAVGSENLAQLQDKIARFQTNGSLGGGEDEIGSILYVAKSFSVDPNKAGITLTAQSYEDFRKYFNENNGTTTDLGVDETALINTMYLGNNTAILVDAAVMSKAAGNNATAVVTFDSNKKGTVIADGGEVIIDGDLRATTYQVFANADIKYLNGDKYAVVEDSTAANYENNINVTTTNEFLQGVVEADGTVDLGIASDGRAIMGGASDPVYETLVAYVNGYNGTPSKDENGVETVAESQKLYNGYIDGPAGEDGNPTKVKNTDYSNSFLQAVISNGNGQDAETAARLGVFGGSVQAAISAGNTSADAIAGRFGMGAQAAGMTFADNGQGAGLWVAPVYRTADSDSFDAEGVEYGVDMNLYGVALGGDYTLSNGLRIGAMFNIGSGDADGQGAGSLATNDFDYYGFAAFAGYTMGQFSVVGDISYTTVDNEVTANTSVDKIGAKFDSTNLSVGVTGQYALNFNGVDVTPHAGMRLSMIDMDDYTVDGENEIANYSADKMTVFSIPVGVTFAKEFEGESWTVKPSFDLTLTGNFGDDKAEGTVEWKGVSNLSTAVSSEVFDNFTYGAAAGVAAKTGNFSLGLGLNYTGSSNVSEFGVNANARFVF